jgi:hypothetical protein
MQMEAVVTPSPRSANLIGLLQKADRLTGFHKGCCRGKTRRTGSHHQGSNACFHDHHGTQLVTESWPVMLDYEPVTYRGMRRSTMGQAPFCPEHLE